jgi:SAM-dependent methyltransferase
MSRYQAVFYPETTFGGFTNIDGTVAFYARVNALARPSFSILDFGCGKGGHAQDPVNFRRNLRCLKGRVARVIGIDIDPAGAGNPTLDEFRLLAPGGPWPVDSGSIDLVLCDFVLEHLQDPGAFFREAGRVLVKGGFVCIRTPNVLSYPGLVSRLVPDRYRKPLLFAAQPERRAGDAFPTFYRCNTIWALRRQMEANGFQAVVVGHDPEPSYLGFSKLAYALGVLSRKLAPSFLRVSIFAFGRLG